MERIAVPLHQGKVLHNLWSEFSVVWPLSYLAADANKCRCPPTVSCAQSDLFTMATV